MSNYIAEKYRTKQSILALDTEALKAYSDVIDLSIGDTDFVTDSRIIEAAMADAKRGYTHYGDPQGDPELIAAIQKAWFEDFGQKVPAENILVTTSSCMGMQLALMATLNPGNEVIVLGPYFGVYAQQISIAGGICIEVATNPDRDFGLNMEKLEKAITPKTRGIIINSPCNPTGSALSVTDMLRLAELCAKYDLLIYADEIYTRYLYDGVFIPMRTIEGMESRTITLNSFSKNYMMTGWRVGFAIAPKPVRETMQMIAGGMTYTAPSISQRAALHALPLRDEIEKNTISIYRSRVMDAADALQNLDYIQLVRPRGTFYLFPDIRRTGMSSREFTAFLLEKAHILVSPGNAFGKSGEGYIRIAVTQKTEIVQEAMERMRFLPI